MTEHRRSLDRRTALRTFAGGAVVALSGCLSGDGPDPASTPAGTDGTGTTSDGPFRHVGVDGTTLVVDLPADKPWEEVYGEDADLLINGEAFVTVENTGSGPETVTELVFSGGVPNPSENPRSNGIHRTDRAVIPVGETVDLYSASFPFGSESPEGMGCSTDGNNGQFMVTMETAVEASPVTQTYDVQYSGSSDMTDCEVTITRA